MTITTEDFDTLYLLSWITGLSRSEILAKSDLQLTDDEQHRLTQALTRRELGEPLQYITGTAPFRFLEVAVQPGVLIPRPETETLVDLALSHIDNVKYPLVADIGTGSGCIACSVASEREHAQVWATDFSPAAIEVAAKNASKLGLSKHINFVECDLLTGIPFKLLNSFDVIISNPPYIPTDVMRTLPKEVLNFEPTLALEAGEDGLRVYRNLLQQAFPYLKPNGLIAVELHETTLEEAKLLAEQAGYVNVSIKYDLTNRPRYLTMLKVGDEKLSRK